MSGSMVLLGIGVVDGEASANLALVAVIAAFVLGALLAHLAHARRRSAGRPLHPVSLVAAEAALVVAAAAWLVVTDLPPPGPGTPWEEFGVLVTLAFAMGLQNAVVLAVGRVAVATTYETGSIDASAGPPPRSWWRRRPTAARSAGSCSCWPRSSSATWRAPPSAPLRAPRRPGCSPPLCPWLRWPSGSLVPPDGRPD